MKRIFNNKVFKFILKMIEVLIFAIIIVYLAFMLIQRFSGDKSVFGYRVYTVATGSMEGVYNINDVIAVKDCDPNKLEVGDDIAYRGTRGGLEGLLVTHRIIKIEEAENGGKLFFTQGVKSNIADPSITASQIVGKVEGVIPVITTLNHIVRSQVGFFICVFCPLVLVIVLEVLQTITDIKIENHELEEIKKESEESDSEKEKSEDVSEKKTNQKEEPILERVSTEDGIEII